jgi:hypothetical protein
MMLATSLAEATGSDREIQPGIRERALRNDSCWVNDAMRLGPRT